MSETRLKNYTVHHGADVRAAMEGVSGHMRDWPDSRTAHMLGAAQCTDVGPSHMPTPPDPDDDQLSLRLKPVSHGRATGGSGKPKDAKPRVHGIAAAFSRSGTVGGLPGTG